MGLLRKRRKGGVRGTARVVSVTGPPRGSTAYSNIRMDLVVEAPDVTPFNCTYRKLAVRVKKWPQPGAVLPVSVDPADTSQVEVLWDEVPDTRDVARQQAEQMAANLRQQGGPGGQPTAGGAGAGGTGAAAQGVAEVISRLQEAFPGATMNVDGRPVTPGASGPQGAGQPPPSGGDVRVVASQSDADPVERLEKLARLRDTGVIDQAQFDQLKAQILGQAGLDGSP